MEATLSQQAEEINTPRTCTPLDQQIHTRRSCTKQRRLLNLTRNVWNVIDSPVFNNWQAITFPARTYHQKTINQSSCQVWLWRWWCWLTKRSKLSHIHVKSWLQTVHVHVFYISWIPSFLFMQASPVVTCGHWFHVKGDIHSEVRNGVRSTQCSPTVGQVGKDAKSSNLPENNIYTTSCPPLPTLVTYRLICFQASSIAWEIT